MTTNPAIVPDEPERVAIRYRVLAGRVFGHNPGDQFEALIPADREKALIASGAIEIVTDTLDNLSRPQLDELAVQKGVDNPVALPNKQAVIDAMAAIDNEE